MKKSQNILCGAVLSALMLFAGCASTDVPADSGAVVPSVAPAKPVAAPTSTLYKGEGMTVAVLSPEFSGGTNDGWIPQSLQDNLTGLFALYSKMSVLDRKNEAVAVAEQTLSESGFYSEENAAQIGRMTNAQYITVGSVQKTGSAYACNFRVNEVETNEIKAAAVGRYLLSALENGTAVKEIARQLLSGLSIELSDAELERLTQKDDAEVKSVTMLAKGDAANKAEKYIEALSFYNQVGGSRKNEAAQSSRAMLAGSFDTSSLKERILYQQQQVEKWNKVFRELEAYMLDHALIAVYDFSVMEDKINTGNNPVNISVTPGIKIFPDRNALSVWKTVLDEWIAVYSDKDNRDWAWTVYKPVFGEIGTGPYNLNYQCISEVGLYNEYEELLKKVDVRSSVRIVVCRNEALIPPLDSPQLKSQKTYFTEARLGKVEFSGIPLSRISSELTVKLIGDIKIEHKDSSKLRKTVTAVYSAEEWQRMNK